MSILVQPAGYLGDYAEDDTVYFIWNTSAAGGAGATRTVAGTVEVYIDNGATQITTGVTDTKDFDSVTGQHLCTIDLSASASYATKKDYAVVCNGMTIDGVGAVNAAIGSFSIENRTATLSNQTHGGAAAVLDLERIDIDATGNNDAVNIAGSGSGDGLQIAGGATGKDIYLTGMTEITGITDVPAEPAVEQALMLLYMWLRNNTSATATERRIMNDAGTEVLDATMADDGTTFSQGKLTGA